MEAFFAAGLNTLRPHRLHKQTSKSCGPLLTILKVEKLTDGRVNSSAIEHCIEECPRLLQFRLVELSLRVSVIEQVLVFNNLLPKVSFPLSGVLELQAQKMRNYESGHC